jgi:hypothetical protein
VPDKHQQSFKVKEKNESEASGADGQTATLPVASSSAAAAAAEEDDEMALSPEDRQFCEKGRKRMEAYADELIPVLIDIIRKYVAPSPMLCVSCVRVCVMCVCVSLTCVGPLKEQAGDGGLPLGRGLHAATHLPPLLPLLVHSLDPPQDGHLRRVSGTPR